jgi:hypothetical protein
MTKDSIALSISVLAALSAGCDSYVLPSALGDQCELNSDCDAPLVCRLGYCRRECSTSRDCAVGLDCIWDDQRHGACQLTTETACVRNSDCPSGLVCTMGECTNVCGCPPGEPCRDCPPGASCVTNPDSTRSCFDPAMRTCVWDSDCPATEDSFVCAFDQRCRVECTTDADCRFGARCTLMRFEEPGGCVLGRFCVDDPPDAGTPACP